MRIYSSLSVSGYMSHRKQTEFDLDELFLNISAFYGMVFKLKMKGTAT